MIRMINQDGDIATSGKMFALDKKEVAINIELRLKMFLGEYFRDRTDGTAWFQDVLLKKPDVSIISEMIQKRISETIGVAQITMLDIDQNLEDRAISITCDILTDQGALISLEGVNVTV